MSILNLIFWNIGQLWRNLYGWRSGNSENRRRAREKGISRAVQICNQIWYILIGCWDIQQQRSTPFMPILAIFWYNWPTCRASNFSKLTQKTLLGTLYLRLKFQVYNSSGRSLTFSKTTKKRRFLIIFFYHCPVFGGWRPDG